LKHTVVILGNADSKSLYDWTRNDADVFVFNEAANTAFKGKPVTGVFQLHDPVIWQNPNNRNDPTHFEWLKSTNVKVYMQARYPEVPMSEEFPRDAVINQIYNGKIMRSATEYEPIREVSCTPAWALAWAIHQGYKRIEIYGVALASNTEYAYQQGNFKFWVGVAIGRGIDLFIASEMFDNPQYGYEGEVEIPYSAFAERIAQLQPQHAAAVAEYEAAQMETSKLLDGFLHGDVTDKIMPSVQRMVHAGGKLGNLDGAIQANTFYQRKADDMIKTSERFIFSRQEFEHNARQAQNNAIEHRAQFNAAAGQLDLFHRTVVNAAKGSPKREKALANYRAIMAQYLKASNIEAGWTGVANENLRYMARLDAGVKAAGGVKSEEAILNSK
jgi:hypothetical protein